jgi:myo-inositol-1(or 4)-monophosphatase
MARSALINVIVSAVMKASRGLKRDFGEVENLQVARKGPADFVTAADRKTEAILREELEIARPGYGFLLEESGEFKGTDTTHRWIIDPIDGTTNFIHGIPNVCVSVALERNGTIVAGVIYNPIMDELFVAERGSGAYMNDRRLRVAPRYKLEDCVITCGIPHRGRGDHAQFISELVRIQARAAGIRRTGSAAIDLAWVAAGRFDGFWERGLSLWDIAAGVLIVREAGGFVGDADNKPDPLVTGNVVAGNDEICQVLMKELKAAKV